MDSILVQEKKSSKNVRANVVINLIRTLTMTILSFITFPYITRALGDQTFGLYTWANAFVYYFLILAKISIPNVAIREVSKVKENKEKLSATVGTFFILQSITTLLSFLLMSVLVFSIPSLYNAQEIIFLLSINFLVGVFSFEWVYIALEKHFYITIRSILLLSFSAVLTFTVIRTSSYPQNYLYVYALIAISSTILTALLNCLLLPKYIKISFKGPYNFKPLIKPLITMLFLSFALTLYNQTDEFILGFIDPSKASVGSYSVGVKGIDIIITLITSLYAVFMPRASYYYEKENKYFYNNLLRYSFNITFFIAVPAIATMATLSTPITTLISGGDLSSTYAGANYILISLSAMMLTYSIGDNIYTEILLPAKKEKYYLYGLLFGVFINVTLSLIFGYYLFASNPAIGVAIGTIIADILMVIYLIYVSKEYSVKAIFNINNMKITIFGLIIAITTIFVYPYIEKSFISLIEGKEYALILSCFLMVLIDALIYIGGLALFKEKLVSSLFRRSKSKDE